MSDLKLIKKYYGEKFMHLCRDLFPTILENDGILFKLIEENFYHNKNLYYDIVNEDKISEFQEYIYSLVYPEKVRSIKTDKNPFELLNEAGYDLYECNTEKEIQKFKKYYQKHEELCTFRDKRLETNYVFFAVKKNVDEIKREHFIRPQRQDEYGTSVISIQFAKTPHNTISIKNRYNHTVNNPDATFSNNLDNIIPGLTESFKSYYNFNIENNNNYDFELNHYVRANDGKLYKYNYEINNVYYCHDNIIINNGYVMPEYQNKESYLVFDYFILDLDNKKLVETKNAYSESFIFDFLFIKKIDILNNKDTKGKIINILFNNDKKAIIELDKENKMIKYYNENIHTLDDDYLKNNKFLKEINFPNVLKIGDSCLENNRFINKLYLEKVVKIGNSFLKWNTALKDYKMPNLKSVGDEFMKFNRGIKILKLESLEIIGDDFFSHNHTVKKVILPKAKIIKDSFLRENRCIIKIILPEVENIGHFFLSSNYELEEIYLPKVKIIKDDFSKNNYFLEKIIMPEIEYIGNDFLYSNNNIRIIDFPKIKEIGSWFLATNNIIKRVSFPNIEIIKNKFLANNELIEEINFPKLKAIGYSFLENNLYLKEINFPKVTVIAQRFLYSNTILNKFSANNLNVIDDYFLPSNDALEILILPKTTKIFSHFIEQNDKLTKFDAPKLKEVDDYFLYYNTTLKEFNAPNIERTGSHFLSHNNFIKEPTFKPRTLKKTL